MPKILIWFSKPGASHENPRFHRVIKFFSIPRPLAAGWLIFNDWGTSRPFLFPPMAVKSKPPAVRVVVDSVTSSRQQEARSQ
jgi:hypothetical protein